MTFRALQTPFVLDIQAGKGIMKSILSYVKT